MYYGTLKETLMLNRNNEAIDVTYRDLLAAMRKNGYKKVRGTYFRYYDEDHNDNLNLSNVHDKWKLIGACAIGQAALNLNVNPDNLFFRMGFEVRSLIIKLNDTTGKTVPEIADIVEDKYPQLLDQKL